MTHPYLQIVDEVQRCLVLADVVPDGCHQLAHGLAHQQWHQYADTQLNQQVKCIDACGAKWRSYYLLVPERMQLICTLYDHAHTPIDTLAWIDRPSKDHFDHQGCSQDADDVARDSEQQSQGTIAIALNDLHSQITATSGV